MRSLTRLKSVFVPLHKAYTLADRALMVGAEHLNDFVNPSWPDVNVLLRTCKQKSEFEVLVQIGFKLDPPSAIISHAETNYQLKKTVGFQSNSMHKSDIARPEYRTHIEFRHLFANIVDAIIQD